MDSPETQAAALRQAGAPPRPWRAGACCQAGRQAQKDSRPVGARIDSARATITRAANRTAAARVAVEAAVAACKTAQKKQRKAQRQLAALEAETASRVNPVEPVTNLVGAVRALLSALESTPLVHAVTNQLPDRLVDHMQAINAALSACPAFHVPKGLLRTRLDLREAQQLVSLLERAEAQQCQFAASRVVSMGACTASGSWRRLPQGDPGPDVLGCSADARRGELLGCPSCSRRLHARQEIARLSPCPPTWRTTSRRTATP